MGRSRGDSQGASYSKCSQKRLAVSLVHRFHGGQTLSGLEGKQGIFLELGLGAVVSLVLRKQVLGHSHKLEASLVHNQTQASGPGEILSSETKVRLKRGFSHYSTSSPSRGPKFTS